MADIYRCIIYGSKSLKLHLVVRNESFGNPMDVCLLLFLHFREYLIRPKKIDPLFSVERPYIENMCAYSLFIGNMQHIVFFYIKIYK